MSRHSILRCDRVGQGEGIIFRGRVFYVMIENSMSQQSCLKLCCDRELARHEVFML